MIVVQFGVYHREGWHCTGDSHQPPARKAAAAGGSGGGGATANGDRASSSVARPGAQPSSAGTHRPAVAPAAGASRQVPAGRGVTPVGSYAGNGPAAGRAAAAPRPKPQQQMAHAPVASPHMMAGRGAAPVHAMPPGAAAAGQARAPMPHPGAMAGQQMHMQQGYRPPVGMHQAPPHQQQQHPHAVAAPHGAHAAHHQAQGVPQYHAAAGRGYTYPPQGMSRSSLPPIALYAVFLQSCSSNNYYAFLIRYLAWA